MSAPPFRAILVAILAALAASTPAPAAEYPDPLPSLYVLEGATVIDGTGAAPIRDAAIVVREGRIAAVGRHGAVAYPESAVVIPVGGRWIIPGLIDAHAHVTTLLTRADSTGAESLRYDRAASEEVLAALLECGVTTVRNPSAPTEEGVALRDAVTRGEVRGPRIVTAGRSLVLGRRRSPDPNVAAVASVAEVRAEVRRQCAAGVDWIKVYGSLPPNLVRAAIEEAHARRVRVVGHLGRTTWTEAASMGIDAIAHGAPWTDECLPPSRRAAYRDAAAVRGPMRARIDWLEWLEPAGPHVGAMIDSLARHKVGLDPTLIAYHTKFWGDDPMYRENPANAHIPSLAAEWSRRTLVDDWTANDFRRAKAAWPKLLALVKRFDEAGLLLTAGSDEPNPWVVPGDGYHRELELLASAGISTARVLTIATRNGARLLGLEREVGTIARGKQADLVILLADPIADIRNVRAIERVIQRGR